MKERIRLFQNQTQSSISCRKGVIIQDSGSSLLSEDVIKERDKVSLKQLQLPIQKRASVDYVVYESLNLYEELII